MKTWAPPVRRPHTRAEHSDATSRRGAARRLHRERPDVAVHVVAVETDDAVVPFLADTLEDCSSSPNVTCDLVAGDYLAGSTGLDADVRMCGPFDLVIMNPPYGKLAANHHDRRAVANAVVDTPNLYAAFWALGVRACQSDGQVVAIVPRSFANGTYFQPFRKWLLDSMRLDPLHVFESRSTVFADTGVLQENVIVSGTVGAESENVVLSASVGHADEVIVAGVWDLPGKPAFENHLNYVHEQGKGLPLDLARGLSVWLNSSPLDELFRTFSGHTQVNAGDLRVLPFPSRDDLSALGRAFPGPLPTQDAVDEVVSRILDSISAVAS